MTGLIIAALCLLVTHFGIAGSSLRPRLVAAMGEPAYRAVYSVVALAATVWLVVAWRTAPFVELWPSGPGLRHLPMLVMPVALLLIACGVMQRNPTAIGAGSGEARGMVRVTRHPVMWGIGLWALVHILANGDLAAILFFATFAVLAFGGMATLDRKYAARDPAGWRQLVASTSILPFRAILDGRQRLRPREIGWAPLAVAAGLFVVLLLLHPWVIGVSPMG